MPRLWWAHDSPRSTPSGPARRRHPVCRAEPSPARRRGKRPSLRPRSRRAPSGFPRNRTCGRDPGYGPRTCRRTSGARARRSPREPRPRRVERPSGHLPSSGESTRKEGAQGLSWGRGRIANRRSTMSEENHKQKLNRLLAELGETLGRREQILEQMKRARTQARVHEITVEADQPFEGWNQDMLVEDLQRELDHQRAQELELQQILDLLEHQRGIEDRLFEELDLHLAPQHRDDLGEIWRQMERRDAIFEDITAASIERKRQLIPEVMEHLRGLEDALFKLIERHLSRMRRS